MAAALTTGLTGCLHDGDDGGDVDDGGDGGDGGDDVDDGGVSTGFRLLSSDFEVVDRVPGNAEDVADVSFDDVEESVDVGGIVHGSNSCKTAELASAGYDDIEDVLELRVDTTDLPDAEEVCAPVITEIFYSVSAEFSGGLPSTVSVYHDGDLVVSAER